MRMGADGVIKMGLENLENFTCALPVFGDTLPAFFLKMCLSVYSIKVFGLFLFHFCNK